MPSKAMCDFDITYLGFTLNKKDAILPCNFYFLSKNYKVK